MEWKRIQAPLGTGALSRARSRIWRTFAALLLLTAPLAPAQGSSSAHTYSGFDANEYPGDASLPALRRQFAFTGYWLNNPPGASHNAWSGKRALLVKNGFGFLVLFNGWREPLPFTLPAEMIGRTWNVVSDSADPSRSDADPSVVPVAARSVLILQAGERV